MKVTKVSCPSCGATPEVDTNLSVAFCQYCGAKIIIDIGKKRTADPKADLELGRLSLQSGDWGEADKYFSRSLQKEPNNEDGLFWKGITSALREDFGKAHTYIKQANIDPESWKEDETTITKVAELFRKSDLYFGKEFVQLTRDAGQGNWWEWVDFFRQLTIQIAPKEIRALSDVCLSLNSYHIRAHPECLIEFLPMALDVDPTNWDNAKSEFFLSVERYQKNELDERLKEAEEFLVDTLEQDVTRKAGVASCYRKLAIVSANNNKYEKAETYLDRSLSIDNSSLSKSDVVGTIRELMDIASRNKKWNWNLRFQIREKKLKFGILGGAIGILSFLGNLVNSRTRLARWGGYGIDIGNAILGLAMVGGFIAGVYNSYKHPSYAEFTVFEGIIGGSFGCLGGTIIGLIAYAVHRGIKSFLGKWRVILVVFITLLVSWLCFAIFGISLV